MTKAAAAKKPASTEPESNLVEIKPQWRGRSWLDDDSLTSVPRRDDLFLDPLYVQERCRTAMAEGKTIRLSWLTPEWYEQIGWHLPTNRSYQHVHVMDLVGYFPSGWVYVQVPEQAHALIVPLDVVTEISIEQ